MPSSQYTQPLSVEASSNMPATAHALHDPQLEMYLELRKLWKTDPLLYVSQRFGVTPTWQQAQILEALTPSSAKVSVRSGHGIGKAQPKDLLIDTPDGRKAFGDLQPGSLVFGPDGLPTAVLAVHDQGNLPVYRILFDDDTSTLACGNHLWTVQGRQERRNGLITWRTLTTTEILALGVKRGNGTNEARQWALPDVSPLQYPFRWVPADPYTLGYWLGDGARKTPLITTMDAEPVARIRAAGYHVRQSVRTSLLESQANVYYISMLHDALKSLGVSACYAYEKFVPAIYKYNIPEIRLAILQGLLDSDGYVDSLGKPSFSSSSQQLAEDVAWLVRSLGGKARVNAARPTSYRRPDGTRVVGRPAPDVSFAFENDLQPLTVARKLARYRPTSQKRYVTRWMEAIKPEGIADCQCITVAHPAGLYLTNDFIVTHNSSSASWAISWFLETHDFAKVPCTAPSSHQLRDILWGELSKWRRKADALSAQRGDPPKYWLTRLFKLVSDSLYDPGAKEWGAFARTARKEDPEALQGFHADDLLYVLDEASGIDEAIYEAAEGALSTPGARVLMLGNPTRTSGTFYASHHRDRGNYTALHFRSDESPLVDAGYRPRLIAKWGEGSNVVRVRADGEFPRQEDDILISLELTEPCLTRERREGGGLRKLGVDVARYGSDRTALVLRHGAIVDHIRVFARQDTMETVGGILRVLEPWKVDEVEVDVVGLGAGVYDRLAELKRQGLIPCTVVPVNVAENAPPVRHPADAKPRLLRDYLWLETAQWLRDSQPVFCAEDQGACEDLAGELASVGYSMDSYGQLVVEDKDHMRKRLGHSPDLGDALCCTFVPTRPRIQAMTFNI